jgi:hypothetical protein
MTRVRPSCPIGRDQSGRRTESTTSNDIVATYHVNPKADPGARAALILTPLELLDRSAALVPPPRIHRHRYFACWRERPLTENFCGDRERLELADSRL